MLPVLGFDGADNFTHVTLRLTDYKEGIAEESELKIKSSSPWQWATTTTRAWRR